MPDFWGPGLDAELAYRHERLFTALRGIPNPSERGDDDHALTATARPDDALAATARPDGSLRPVHPAHPLVSAARGWLLRGSETWHVAR
ncbi:hypothetical protein HP550_16265 [Cellulomonas humilata]|uniref:Uncharacterized protein n=1 Tax=Cellulomonas humilata TaxID=144055 RepID=A0A7Y6A2Z6_9CELL|nr:hypothetical protein [Cellulomonas humilata]NUU18808.1 hypothetical protein [Cellulomonas humilata]